MRLLWNLSKPESESEFIFLQMVLSEKYLPLPLVINRAQSMFLHILSLPFKSDSGSGRERERRGMTSSKHCLSGSQPPTMNSKIRLSAVTLLCTILIIKYFLWLFAWMIPTLSHLYCLYVCRVKVIFHVDLNACHFPEPSLFELLYIPQLGFVLG